MGDWAEQRLGAVLELKRGYDLPSSSRIPGQIPLISSSGPSDFVSEAKVLGPGVVTGRYGTLGQVFFLDQPFWPLNTTLYVRDFKGNDPRFISYFLKTIDFMAYSDKAAVPGLNRNDLHDALVYLPSEIAEQRAIAKVLSSIDDKIELNEGMNATLEGMAQAIFRDWFVDFGPVRRKLAGGADPVAILGDLIPDPAKAAPLAALFPDTLGDGGLPVGWVERSIGSLAQIKGGKQLAKEEFVDDGPVPVFGGAGHMGQTDKSNADGYVITVGRVGAYCGNFVAQRGKAWVNNNASNIRNNREVPAEWLFLALRELDMAVIKKGAAQPFISNGDLANLVTVWPTIDLLTAFQAVALPLIERSEATGVGNRALAETRDYLLPRLMSGKIRVADAERMAS